MNFTTLKIKETKVIQNFSQSPKKIAAHSTKRFETYAKYDINNVIGILFQILVFVHVSQTM